MLQSWQAFLLAPFIAIFPIEKRYYNSSTINLRLKGAALCTLPLHFFAFSGKPYPRGENNKSLVQKLMRGSRDQGTLELILYCD
ncbi:MAG: hypothetical protein RLZZ435_2528 [Cyanobacteriota bacterium]|jgi:hypothetical protein